MSNHILPRIPSPNDLASDPLVHRWSDLLFNPPGVQNEWGQAQATRSVSGLQAVTFPPYVSNSVYGNQWNKAYTVTCETMLDGRIVQSYPRPAGDITYTWYPHVLVRETSVDDVHIRTETFMPPQRRAVAERIVLTNTGTARREGTLAFLLRAGVARVEVDPWPTRAPSEADNTVTVSAHHGCLVFQARHSEAVSVQGIRPHPTRVEHGIQSVHPYSLGPGETAVFTYVHVLAPDAESGLALYDDLQAQFDAVQAETLDTWTQRLRNAFTPDNPEFSGHLPTLVTCDKALWRLYHVALASLLFSRVDSPDAALRPAYRSIGARYHQTATNWPWDIGLISLSLGLLEPVALRQALEAWFTQHPHRHATLNYLTGQSFGDWYAANDLSLIQAAEGYLRVTGDFAWLDKRVGDKTVLEHLVGCATYWQTLDRGNGLADYSGSPLLEVISTYSGAVAALNAGNVYAMRFVAALLDRRGDQGQAVALRNEANALARQTIDTLYVAGGGYWRCKLPDGNFHEVRHVYDVLTTLDCLDGDLTDTQRAEMAAFFWRELHTPHWLRALSPYDVDTSWNVRADHSWCGSYPMWPPKMARVLYKREDSARVSRWVKGLAATANQGVFGQAHLDDTVFPTENGGARKCPPEVPFENEFCSLAGTAFIDLIVDSIFGADLTLFDGLRVAHSHVANFDPDARLENLRYRDRLYTVTRDGAVEQAASAIGR